jgi:hypothetical protein
MKWGRCDLLSADFLHKWWNHRSQRHHILIMLGSDCIQEGQRQALRRAHGRGDGVGGDARIERRRHTEHLSTLLKVKGLLRGIWC